MRSSTIARRITAAAAAAALSLVALGATAAASSDTSGHGVGQPIAKKADGRAI